MSRAGEIIQWVKFVDEGGTPAAAVVDKQHHLNTAHGYDYQGRRDYTDEHPDSKDSDGTKPNGMTGSGGPLVQGGKSGNKMDGSDKKKMDTRAKD